MSSCNWEENSIVWILYFVFSHTPARLASLISLSVGLEFVPADLLDIREWAYLLEECAANMGAVKERISIDLQSFNRNIEYK